MTKKRCVKKLCEGDEVRTITTVMDLCDMGQRGKIMHIEGDQLAVKLKNPRHWQSEYIRLYPVEVEKVN